MKIIFFAVMTVIIVYLYQFNLKIANQFESQKPIKQISVTNVDLINDQDMIREIILYSITTIYEAAVNHLDLKGIEFNNANLEINFFFNSKAHNDLNIMIYDINNNNHLITEVYRKKYPSWENDELAELVIPIVKDLLLYHKKYQGIRA